MDKESSRLVAELFRATADFIAEVGLAAAAPTLEWCSRRLREAVIQAAEKSQ